MSQLTRIVDALLNIMVVVLPTMVVPSSVDFCGMPKIVMVVPLEVIVSTDHTLKSREFKLFGSTF